MPANNGRFSRRIPIILVVVIVLLGAALIWYVNDFYHADDTANAVMADANGDADGVVVRELSGKALAFVPDHPVAGFVFYPGAKVQPEAYAPLMQACAERGVLCVIVKPLFNLAIIDGNCADGMIDQFPEVKTWMIGGHSMGGVAASGYAADHPGEFEGIVLLASYPSVDLSDSEEQVLSVAGTNDQVLNRQNYEDAFAKLPDGVTELSIEGGNHAYFGDYGEQAGDGAASISREEQQEQTADAIGRLAEREMS